MKRIKNLSKFMLAVMTMLVMISCGGSGDDANNGAAYTPEEIKGILIGNWTYYGNFIYKTENGIVAGDFNGNASFTDRKVSYNNMEVTITENTLVMDEKEAKSIPVAAFYSTYYTINKAGGKNYISFKVIPFEIVSLTKNTFVFRADDDLKDYKGNVTGHLNMTINSK